MPRKKQAQAPVAEYAVIVRVEFKGSDGKTTSVGLMLPPGSEPACRVIKLTL